MRIIIGTLLTAVIASAAASPVHVQVNQGGSVEYGAGFSVGNGTDCFIVTPHHVVETAQQDEITVTDSHGHETKANVLKEVPADDLALLKAREPGKIECPEEWPDGTAADKAVQGAKWLTVKKVSGESGMTQTRWFVSSATPEGLVLQPYGNNDKLEKGDSGSSVYVDDILVGMVLSAKTGEGTVNVVTQRKIFGSFNADLSPGTRMVAMMQPIVYRNQENPYATIAAREYLANRTPMTLQEMGIDPQHGAMANLPSADVVPKGIDYVVLGNIVEITTQREANPNFKPAAQQDKKGGFGAQFMKSMKSALSGKNEDAPYYVTYNIDVEVQVLDVKRNNSARNLERVGMKYPQRQTDDPREIEKTAVQQAVTQALDKTFRKYDLPRR